MSLFRLVTGSTSSSRGRQPCTPCHFAPSFMRCRKTTSESGPGKASGTAAQPTLVPSLRWASQMQASPSATPRYWPPHAPHCPNVPPPQPPFQHPCRSIFCSAVSDHPSYLGGCTSTPTPNILSIKHQSRLVIFPGAHQPWFVPSGCHGQVWAPPEGHPHGTAP